MALGLPFELFIWASLIYILKSQEKRYFGLFEGHFTVFCSELGIPNRKHFLLGRENMWRALALGLALALAFSKTCNRFGFNLRGTKEVP